jgi:hypothetical protein
LEVCYEKLDLAHAQKVKTLGFLVAEKEKVVFGDFFRKRDVDQFS